MRFHLIVASVLICAALTDSTRANLIGGTYVSSPIGTAWPGLPVYTSLASPATGSTAQGAPTPTDTGGDPGVTATALSEIFTPTSNITLGSIALVGSGGTSSNNTLNMRLYTLGTHGGTGFPNGNNGASGDNFYFAGTELLGTSGAGFFFNFPGFTGQKVMTFNLSDGPSSNDQINLTAGTTYALEMWIPSSNPSLFSWGRDGTTMDPGGQMMGTPDASDFTHSRNSLAALSLASGPRTGALALYAAPIPEPCSFCVIAFVALSMTSRRRRHER